MNALHHQVCLRHTQREAVARCPECRQFFCRECVTEHEDRLLCATCLRKLARPTQARRGAFVAMTARGAALVTSLGIAWLAYYWLGLILLKIPAEVHDATLWRTTFFQE
jgi:predicted small integral membrane protein